MTYCKTGTEFPDDAAAAGLSDAAYRTHHEGITWLYRVEAMDLRIPKHLLRRIVGSDQYETAVKDLVAIDWWSDDGDAWTLLHHGDVIRSSIVAQRKKRARDKRSQAAYRERQSDTNTTADVGTDISADADSQSKDRSTGDLNVDVKPAPKGSDDDVRNDVEMCPDCTWPYGSIVHRRKCESQAA